MRDKIANCLLAIAMGIISGIITVGLGKITYLVGKKANAKFNADVRSSYAQTQDADTHLKSSKALERIATAIESLAKVNHPSENRPACIPEIVPFKTPRTFPVDCQKGGCFEKAGTTEVNRR